MISRRNRINMDERIGGEDEGKKDEIIDRQENEIDDNENKETEDN